MVDLNRRLALDAAIELTHFAYRAMTARPDALLAAAGSRGCITVSCTSSCACRSRR